ncbi:hypothetical protein [Lentzea sp. NPDC003310]|uniref:hypothetical protein n=1 Tax=Lentzea sp. NPDC003310 TaxID=3154447 RepID=UPI00339FB1C0
MDHEDTLRDTFSLLGGEVAPPNGNSAAGVIRRGRAVRSRRRTAAVIGSALATAAVAALALVLLPDPPSTPDPGPPLPSTTVLTTPSGGPSTTR